MKADPTDQGMSDVTGPYGDEALRKRLMECQRLALVGRLSTIVTHEINNHLTGVSGYAQLLLDNEAAAGFTKELTRINSSAHRCQNLIKEIRRLGRFESGAGEVNNINLILRACLDLVRRQFERESHELTEDFSPEAPTQELDAMAIEQAFLNVIQNSFEAFEKRGGRLTISTRREGEQAVAIFDDDGPGLSAEAKENLFTPFFTTKQELNCPGLGLAAAKMAIESHNGTIEVGEAPTGGARVRIALPIKP
jgi:two-component system NtrC family sensor kinase